MKLLLGDCVEKLREIPVESVDSVVTDPPYEINFMGSRWDNAGVANSVPMWTELRHTLKPGGHLLSFGGTRTHHRMTCAIEDAGFEIRDCLMWIYGSGFPKSKNIKGGLGTALKPAWEPIVLARKPLDGTTEDCVTSYGTGALNIDACRVEGINPSVERRQGKAPGESMGATGWVSTARPSSYSEPREGEDAGRWPANLMLSHTSECAMTGTAMAPGRSMNRYTDGVKPFGGGVGHPHDSTTMPDEEVEVWDCTPDCPIGEIGESSRFFYCAKVIDVERNAGGFNWHPTVKPIDLMRYLVRLVTPVGGTVLDPFMGSGSTGIAAHLEERKFIGIEQDKEYMKIAKKRIKYWQEHGENALAAAVSEQTRERIAATGQLNMMDLL